MSFDQIYAKLQSIYRRLSFLSSKISNIDKFPSQTGNTGKVLVTDGTALSWATPASGGGVKDATPTDGSTNPVESNGVFDALALKADSTALALKADSTAVALKADDNAVVHLTGIETVTGRKTFSGGISSSLADTSTSGTVTTNTIAITSTPASASGVTVQGISSTATYSGANDNTGLNTGILGVSLTTGVGKSLQNQGVFGMSEYTGSSTSASQFSLYGGLFFSKNSGTGKALHMIGIKLSQPTNNGTISQGFGLYVADQNPLGTGSILQNTSAIFIEGAGSTTSNGISFGGGNGSTLNASIFSPSAAVINMYANGGVNVINAAGTNAVLTAQARNVPDGALSTNVPLLSADQSWAGYNIHNTAIGVNNALGHVTSTFTQYQHNAGVTVNANTGFNPNIALSLNGTAVAQFAYNGSETYIITANTNPISFFVNSSRLMQLKSTGALLINTTTDNGTDKLQVSGSANVSTNLTVGGTIVSTGNTSAPTVFATTQFTGSSASGGNTTITSTSNGTKGKILFGTTAAYDEANTSLGIGITTPTSLSATTTLTNIQAHNAATLGHLVLSSALTSASAMGGISFGSTALSGTDKRTALILSNKLDALTVNPIGNLTFSTANGGAPVVKWIIDNVGNFYAQSDNTYDVGSAGARPRNVNVGTIVVSPAIRITASTPPASAAATGVTGDIRWDSGFLYVCIATNTWVRTALTTW